MASAQDVFEVLRQVKFPGLGTDIVALGIDVRGNMVRHLAGPAAEFYAHVERGGSDPERASVIQFVRAPEPDVMALSPEDGLRQVLEPQGIQSLIAMPMMDGDRCLGFAGFESVRQ